MALLKVTFVVARDSVDSVSQSLHQAGAIALSLFDAGSDAILETDGETMTLWPDVRVEALLNIGTSLQPIRSTLAKHGARDLTVSFVQEMEWENAWRGHSTHKQFGRLHVLHRESPAEVKGPLVRLDPGLAFGTGEHATTAMCLNWLESINLHGKSVLDFGCGSGILGLAASKLGAASVEAVDHDEKALEVTRQNASFNGVELTVGKSIPIGRKFDVVVANILLNTLVEHSSELINSIARDGVIGLSGLLAAQRESIVKAFTSLCFERPVQEDEWILMIGRESPHDI